MIVAFFILWRRPGDGALAVANFGFRTAMRARGPMTYK
jgi:hypothetical protein